MTKAGKKWTVFIVSDSSGGSAAHLLRAHGELFKGMEVDDRSRTMIHTDRRIREIVKEASDCGGCIVYTFARLDLREEMRHQAAAHDVPATDVSGPLLEMLHQWSGIKPASEPSHVDNEDWYEAVQFFHSCEDGQNPRMFLKADAVLVGLSRTKKTPTCLQLGIRRVRAANYPLVLNIEPLRELFEVEPSRVFVLTMQPGRLLEYRRHRHSRSGASDDDVYIDRTHILEECRMVVKLLAQNPSWRQIDVTGMGSEEIAGRVIQLLKQNGT